MIHNTIIKKFKTIGVIENYYFDYDMECYLYDLTILINGNLVKNRYCTHNDEDSDIFSKELLAKFNERTQDTKGECAPLAVKIKANIIHYPENPENDYIKLEHISRKNGPKADTHHTKTFTGVITDFERDKRSNTTVNFKISTSESAFSTDIDKFTGIDLTKPVTITLCKPLITPTQMHPYEITDIKNA